MICRRAERQKGNLEYEPQGTSEINDLSKVNVDIGIFNHPIGLASCSTETTQNCPNKSLTSVRCRVPRYLAGKTLHELKVDWLGVPLIAV